ncbi:MAG: leucine-rich repeat protein [Ruminococcus sp.]
MKIKRFIAGLLSCAVIGGVLPYGSSITENSAITVSAAEDTYESLTYMNFGDFIVISGCDKSVTEVIIPSEIEGVPVTSIGFSSFNQCSDLTSITIPDSVTSIGYSAFSGCKNLTSITIPDSVTSIGNLAFNSCYSLISITIPDSVTSIGAMAFDSTPWLESQRKISPLVIVNNMLIDGHTCEGAIVIPDGITSIGEEAFYYCFNLTSITIPDSVTSIGAYAFFACYGLTSITIPDGVTSIGDSAFEVCSGLTSITIPDGVTSIGVGAFIGCSGLTSITIQDGVTSIGDYAFHECYGLTSITIPESVTSIGGSAFYNCTSLKSITIENPECEINGASDTIADTAIIYGYENSTAQAYANKYGREFAKIGEEPVVTTTATTTTTKVTTTTTSKTTTTTKATTTTTTTEPATDIVYGDADLDGKVGISDVVKVMMYVANKDANPISEQGLINSDVYGSGDGVFISDALSIQKKVAQIIDTLPES